MSDELKKIMAELEMRFKELDRTMSYLMQTLSVSFEYIVRMEKWISDQKKRSLN